MNPTPRKAGGALDAHDAPLSERKRGRPRGTPTTTSELLTPLSSMAPTPSPARRRGCNCKKSGCLKLYCECFAANVRCGERCMCMGCKNREHNKLEIAHAMETIEKRSQRSFKSPVAVARKLETLRANTPQHGQGLSTPGLDGATRLLMSAERLEETPQRGANCICTPGACNASCPCHENFGWCSRRCPCQKAPTTQEKTRGCSCKKSNCLKLYCECLAAQRVCDSRCNCEGCKNRSEHGEERERAISVILERNPMAFQPKVASGASQHLRGCNCRKSNCMKNYCECHQAGVPCTSRCACQGCRNTDAFVSAKKMLIFSGDLKIRGTTSPEGHLHAATPSSKPPRRPSRRASMDQTSPVSQFRTPTHQMPSALEMLSRTAPRATQHEDPYLFIAGQNARMQAHTKRKHFESDDRSGDSSGDNKKRSMKLSSSRSTFQDRLDRVATPTFQLPSVESVLDEELNPARPELPLTKLCRSLLNAAQSVDVTPTPRKTDRSPAHARGFNAISNETKEEEQNEEGDADNSPEADDLLCEEDIETPTRNSSGGSKAEGSDQRRSLDAEDQRRAVAARLAALQERAVLQEFSVWLRNLTTSNSHLFPPK